ncbi:MAG: hypothetical protein Q7T59_02500 [Candidatus Woesebacteria bacterium]|nr:hypothetical protein [Candidatus Woesebacteria bacterium]
MSRVLKIRLELTEEAKETLAAEKPLQTWSLNAVPEDCYAWGRPNARNLILTHLEVTLPSRESLIPVALAFLSNREKELRDELNVALADLEERRQQLLMITMAPAAEAVPPHGIPNQFPLSEDWREQTTCLKTGCAMFLGTSHQFWGDLHQDAVGRYFFNATSEEGDSYQEYEIPENECIVTFGTQPTTRCGKVFVTEGVTFNKAFLDFNNIWNS